MPSAIKQTTAAVPSNRTILGLMNSTIVYKRNTAISGGASTSATTRRTLNIPSWMLIGINGSIHTLSAALNLDLDTAANWDSAESTYATAANRAGKDFYIYACQDTPSIDSPSIVLSALSTFPADYTADTSRKVGGFHCLCVDVGTIASHDLTGYLDGDILPLSVWDLLHRAQSENEGMVWDERVGIWVDIYLASGTGSSTVSENGGTISDTRNWMDFVDDFAAVNKRMLEDDEFATIAAGSNEETNISGSADPGTTGGHSDTASRRIISDIGCEDCCGVVWQWLRTSSAFYKGTTGYYGALPGGKGSIYTVFTADPGAADVNNSDAGMDVKLLAGGTWDAAASCGSRSRAADASRWRTLARIGARGCSEPRAVTLN